MATAVFESNTQKGKLSKFFLSIDHLTLKISQPNHAAKKMLNTAAKISVKNELVKVHRNKKLKIDKC